VVSVYSMVVVHRADAIAEDSRRCWSRRRWSQHTSSLWHDSFTDTDDGWWLNTSKCYFCFHRWYRRSTRPGLLSLMTPTQNC